MTMEQLAQFVSKSFDHKAIVDCDSKKNCGTSMADSITTTISSISTNTTTTTSTSARTIITLSVAHLIGKLKDSSTDHCMNIIESLVFFVIDMELL